MNCEATDLLASMAFLTTRPNHSKHLNVKNRTVSSVICQEFKNQVLELSRTFDTVMPDYLLFETKEDTSIEAFKKMIEPCKFQIITDTQLIINNKISLYCLFEELKQMNSRKFIVKFPFYWMMPELPIYRIINPLQCEILHVPFPIEKVSMYSSVSLMSDRNLNVSNVLNFNQLSSFYPSRSTEEKISVKLPFYDLSFGYFIQGNISDIKHLEIKGITNLWSFDSITIDLYCKKINDNLLFIPFSKNTNYKQITTEQYINCNHIVGTDENDNKLELNVTFNSGNIENLISVHSICLNYLDIMSNYLLMTRFLIKSIHEEEQTPILYKQIGDRNTECPIMLTEIKENDSYSTCETCSYNFTFFAIQEYFKNKSVKKCPMCKCIWNNLIRYVNKSE